MRPLQFAPISGRRSSISRVTWWIAPSLGLHAVLAIASGVSLVHRAKDDNRPAHEVIFLAPLLPKTDPASDAKAGDGLPGGVLGWPGTGPATLGVGDVTGTTAGRIEGTGHALAQAVHELEAPAAVEPTVGDDHVFQAVDVDREVERAGDAVAPVYPEQLRVSGVTGGVTVEFVVDTTGRVEEGSLHVIGATHPLFAAAVRDAAPSMHFRPAVRAGRVVRQQVVQSFQFVLQPPTAPGDTTPAPADTSDKPNAPNAPSAPNGPGA